MKKMLQEKRNINWSIVKAVIFDVDGTLYNQHKLRRYMLLNLLRYYISHPWCLRELKILRDFRLERERQAFKVEVDIENAQYNWGAQVSGVSPERVKSVIQEWIFKVPLRYMSNCRYPGILDFFNNLSHQGIATAIFSDYPADDKVAALELSPDCIVCTTDRNVDALKPNPKGLFVVAETLGVSIKHCLFIGDRDDRDGECARRAGMPYLILERENSRRSKQFRMYRELNTHLSVSL